MLLPHSRLRTFFASTVCGNKITQKFICQRSMIFFVSGSDPRYFNTVINIIFYEFVDFLFILMVKRVSRGNNLWRCRLLL
jgi:hypothetical protein